MSETIPKHIGELNGPWAFWFKVTLASGPILAAGAGWVAVEVFATLRQHERELVGLKSEVVILTKELMPMEQRMRMFVPRAEWEMAARSHVIEHTSDMVNLRREIAEIKEEQKEQSHKLDAILARGLK
jgi:hypothetical protein